ncbi:hypothetical protein V0288_10815 [Pannus brasiliensis CCIBt3594]|uniref:Baseplate protein J-like domain-containing protein n=1 Tax=Pannus brasiliensis CCIBt3594 TaxID=1427578 RepID=A0AAW9QIJ2_9CHRO
MLSQLTIPKKQSRPLPMDRQRLYEIGLQYIQRLSSRIWTDYNVHDPGITILEILSYALTDLSYRTSLPIEDLLASYHGETDGIQQCLFTAREILPNRALTLLDYRKILIDIEGIKNAWLYPHGLTYYADMEKGKVLREDPGGKGIVPVNIAGLYDIKIEFDRDIEAEDTRKKILGFARQKLQINRNLCEDFVAFTAVETQDFQLCAEIELTSDANVTKVQAILLEQIQEYLAPSVRFYSLGEMLDRTKFDGTPYTVDEIFDGPALENGFIDDGELKKADLRTEIRLSDIISILMDIEGVQAVRDIVINPEGQNISLENKWVIPIDGGKQARLNVTASRLVFYKRNMPVVPGTFEGETTNNSPATDSPNDLPIPLGTDRAIDTYYSLQNHFPEIYGLSPAGLGSAADDRRKALAYQLKAYLLFFDQILANYLAQLVRVKELFSIDPDLRRTYYSSLVTSFADYQRIYAGNDVIDNLQNASNQREEETKFDRRNRFLDHLIARFSSRFTDLANILYSAFEESPENIIRLKCEFLSTYPTISRERGLAYTYSLTEDNDFWDDENVSGFEKRLAKLLGIRDFRRRNLSDGGEGMYAIEHILLLPEEKDDPFLPICPNPNCTDCAEADPYSYRLSIVLPAYSDRFRNSHFRQFVEEVIREETPAHILPKICWIDQENMAEFEKLYREWIYLKAEVDTGDRTEKLQKFIEKLFAVKNVYPPRKLHECDSEENQAKFILGQTILGSEKSIES